MREGQHPLGVVREAVARGIDSVIVGVSGGMDSVVTLDLAVQHFKTIRPYFMFIVPGLGFQERYLTYLERKFSVTIDRVPHWMLANMLRNGVLRHDTQAASTLRKCRPGHFAEWIRKRTGLSWIATGEKAGDSLERNANMVRDGAIQPARQRLYPLAWWSTSDVQSHLARNHIALPPDYRLNAASPESLCNQRGSSFGGILPMREILSIQEYYPDDFKKVVKMFPLVETQIQRWKQLNERGIVGRSASSGRQSSSSERPV